MIGIEQIKAVIDAVIAIVQNIKLTGKPALALAMSIGKIVNIKFKDISKEVKDMDKAERIELVQYIIEKGFKASVAEKAVANLESDKRTTFFNLAKDLLKSK